LPTIILYAGSVAPGALTQWFFRRFAWAESDYAQERIASSYRVARTIQIICFQLNKKSEGYD
jgi:hypothetical protein